MGRQELQETEHHFIRYNDLFPIGLLWTHLIALNEQAQNFLERITEQMKASDTLHKVGFLAAVDGKCVAAVSLSSRERE